MGGSTSKAVRLFLALIFVLVLAGTTGCAGVSALDPLASSDSRLVNPNKNSALTLASYRAQKKYDLLLKRLQEEYEKNKKDGLLIGQLYANVDLAEFYTYGFINYKRSLDLYEEADDLNKRIRESGHAEDASGKAVITYFQASGRYAVPRKYDFQKISDRIAVGRKRINRIFRHRTIGGADDSELPAIVKLVTDDYAFAIHVERDLLSPEHFNRFKEKLVRETRAYFKQRYKLPQSDHDYYISFNILRGLASVFEFSSLSASQIRTIAALIEKTRAATLEKRNELQDAYLNFVDVLCLTEMGEHKKALVAFENFRRKIERINKELDDHLEYLKASRDKAIAKATTKTIGFTALTIFTMGAAMASGGGFYINMAGAGVLDFAGSVASIQRQLTFAGESAYSKSWNTLLNMDDQLQLFRAAGKLYHTTGNLEQSILFNREAVNIITNLRSTITTEKGRVSFAGFRDEIYAYLIEDLFRTGKHAEAFYYAENSRARSLVDLLGSKAGLSFGDRDAYAKRMKDIQVYRDRLRGTIAISDQQIEYIKGLEEELDKDLYKGMGRGVKITGKSAVKKEDPRQSSESDTDVPYDELMTLITVKNLNLQEIQRILPENSTLIEYFVAYNGIYVWVLDKKNFFPVALTVDPKSLRGDIRQLIQGIKAGRHGDQAALLERAKSIYERLFQPLEGHIVNKSVYLVCHDFLHFLPFDALFTGSGYLTEKYFFSYLPSSSVMRFLKPIDPSQKRLLVLGNPELPRSLNLPALPGAELEAVRISALFLNKKVFIRDKATETNFRQESPAFNITHIACHGLFDEQDALNSKLFLSPDARHDGQITVKELYGFSKVSDLIVLSACETARAEIGKGDELLGLMRGIFFSGASSLVASLWNVDDIGTLKMMESFYNHMIKENIPPLAALQKAKRDMIRSREFNSPYFWAAFNLYGLGL